MLEEILAFIHNYFIKEIHRGMFKISDGQLLCDFLQEGQYFRIRGSIFNDGVYQYPASDLADEVFKGEVWAMAVPPSVVDLSERISEWVTKYGDSVSSPYSSESFGGYSYQKASSGQGNAGSSSPTWQSTFAIELNRWRKI